MSANTPEDKKKKNVTPVKEEGDGEQSCVATQEPVSESVPLSPAPPYSKLSRIGSCPVSRRKRSRSSGVIPMEALLVMGWKKTMAWPPSRRSRSRTSFTLWSLSKSTESAVAQPCPTWPGGRGASVRVQQVSQPHCPQVVGPITHAALSSRG